MSEEEKSVINKLESIKVNVEGKLYNFEAERILYLINKLKKENEEKDKQIDLMAEWISERCLYIDDYVNSCEIIQDSCNKRNNCEKCIKQYFEKLANEKGE